MKESGLLTAYFGTSEVVVAGGFNHPVKGHVVEIVGTETNIPRQSISIWELHYASIEMARNTFATCFKCTPEQARDKDQKKGVLKTPLNLLKEAAVA